MKTWEPQGRQPVRYTLEMGLGLERQTLHRLPQQSTINSDLRFQPQRFIFLVSQYLKYYTKILKLFSLKCGSKFYLCLYPSSWWLAWDIVVWRSTLVISMLTFVCWCRCMRIPAFTSRSLSWGLHSHDSKSALPLWRGLLLTSTTSTENSSPNCPIVRGYRSQDFKKKNTIPIGHSHSTIIRSD